MTAKRAFDVLGGLALLVVLLPVLAAVALSVALGGTTPGRGVLRRRTVAGLDGRAFTMLTFRTRSPLAALPLLLHVVAGQMSLVGPCPLTPSHRECAGEGRLPACTPRTHRTVADQRAIGTTVGGARAARSPLCGPPLARDGPDHPGAYASSSPQTSRGKVCLSDTDHRECRYSAGP